MNRIILSVVFVLAVILLYSCSSPEDESISFMFYNVENMFDTIDNPNKNDDAFLPGSRLNWNSEKYQKKLESISRVLSSVDKNRLPSIIGISEVENINVLEDLLKTPALSESGYKIVYCDSQDERGLDDAMLYNPREFKLVSSKFLKISFPKNNLYSSTYILYAKGVIKNNDTLHVFINHWISRWKGKEITEFFRIYTADKLRSFVDSIFIVNSSANILIAGDFNDNPSNMSMESDLKTLFPRKPLNKKSLYNLALIPYEKGEGTVYNNGWDMFDQIIISTSLLTGENGLQVTSASQRIVDYKWMLKKVNGVMIPYRTATNEYLGGYSDHLPVFIEIKVDDTKDVSSII